MLRTLLTTGALLACFAGGVLAQDPPVDQSALIAELRQQIADLQQQITALQGGGNAGQLEDPVLQEVYDNLEDDNLKKLVARADQRFATANRAIGGLAQNFQGVVGTQGENLAGSIYANMERSPEFRQNVARTVRRQLAVSNFTGFTQVLSINGAEWNVPPGEHTVFVPMQERTVVALKHFGQAIQFGEDQWAPPTAENPYFIARLHIN